MLDVDQRTHKDRQASLAKWITHAVRLQGVRLRTRLRGNNLHILCESTQCPEAATVVPQFVQALKATQEAAGLLSDLENLIEKVILYGRAIERPRPDWIEQINISQLDRHLQRWQTQTKLNGIVSNPSLAESGEPEAIAQYLSETLSPLEVDIKVFSQILPKNGQSGGIGVHEHPASYPLPAQGDADYRLWVVCDSESPLDSSLLADRVAGHLRSLNLQGFRDAVIRSQSRGEAKPDWVLRIDLTPPEEMLKDWARWGDVQAIARLLNQTLAAQALEVRAELKDLTLHLLCSLLPTASKPVGTPTRENALSAIAPVLESLAPQGIQAVTVYGVKPSRHPELTPESPVWIEWLNLPASKHPTLAPTPLVLAQQGDQDALTFLLQRLINPDLDRRLDTGGIRVAIRRKHDLLHIMSEAAVCPLQSQVGQPIAKFLRQLEIPEIAGVRVYGRRAGQSSPLWSYGIDFVNRRLPKQKPASESNVQSRDGFVTPDELHEAIAKNDSKNPLQRTIGSVGRTLHKSLCYTQLFIPDSQIKTKEQVSVSPLSVSPENYASSQAVKVALVWGTLGLLLTIQGDWLISYLLLPSSKSVQSSVVAKQEARNKVDPSLKNPLEKGAQATASSESFPLPQLSLQKSRGDQAKVFNASSFTRAGETSVIVNDDQEPENPQTLSNTTGTTAAVLAAARSSNASFNNQMLDEKLALYQQVCATSGPPDILIVGSSRALRGVDPVALQTALTSQGNPNVKIFNFGINGATAQVVDLLLRRILKSDQLPKLILWADGARAFNSGRVDNTYNAIAASAGYQQLSANTLSNSGGVTQGSNGSQASPASNTQASHTSLATSYQAVNQWLNQALGAVSSTYGQRDRLKTLLRQEYAQVAPKAEIPAQVEASSLSVQYPVSQTGIDFDGFLPVSIRFRPSTYYQQHAKVSGDYDNDYESFQLVGQQDIALQALIPYLQNHQIPLVFVNMPLTKHYLDPIRQGYEAQFQRYMQQLGIQKKLNFRDMTQLWPSKLDYFSDPSHLNRYGAYEVSNRLVQDSVISWHQKSY